jgi:hypothetical protein
VPGITEPLPVTPLDPVTFSWGPIRFSGLYGLTWSAPGDEGGDTRFFAVNCLSEVEGDIHPAEQILAKERDVHVAGSGGGEYMPLWPWALGFCLAVLMLEWWFYHRKAYI